MSWKESTLPRGLVKTCVFHKPWLVELGGKGEGTGARREICGDEINGHLYPRSHVAHFLFQRTQAKNTCFNSLSRFVVKRSLLCKHNVIREKLVFVQQRAGGVLRKDFSRPLFFWQINMNAGRVRFGFNFKGRGGWLVIF